MKIKILRQTHPEYDGNRYATIEALYKGGRAWRARVSQFVPKNEAETDKLWTERKLRAIYTNHVGPILNRIAANLFSEAPALENVPSEWWGEWWKSVDGAATPGNRWWRARFTEALKFRCSYIWINMPARPEGVQADNRRQEEALKLLDAFLVPLTADQVLDWGVDSKGALTWVLFYDVASLREGPEAERAPSHRWTYIDKASIKRWEWSPPVGKPEQVPVDADDAKVTVDIQHGIGRLPVVRLELPHGLWAGEKIRDPAISYLRGRNDLEWALHRAAHALMIVKAKWAVDGIALAPGYILPLEREDSVEYAEPSGRNFEILRSDCKDRREDLYRVVDQLAMAADSDANRVSMSGESKNQDWRSMAIVLTAYADIVRSAMREVVLVVAAARNEDGEALTVNGLFEQEEGLRTFLENSAMAVDARALSPTFRKLVAIREATRLLQDEVDAEDLEAVIEEIKAANMVDDAVWVSPTEETEETDDAGGGKGSGSPGKGGKTPMHLKGSKGGKRPTKPPTDTKPDSLTQ